MIEWLILLALQAPAVNLRGLSLVDSQTAWASGQKGTYLRTVDGGAHWVAAVVPGAEALDFRGVQAFSRDEALLMAAGPGDASRVYRTTDGGAHWTATLRNDAPTGFFDCMAFWSARHGLLLGDPVDGRFVVMRTNDGGATWKRTPISGMPPANPGEGAFAASGTCIATGLDGRTAWFGTGGVQGGRVFRTADGGETWTAVDTPIRHDSARSGVFSIAFRDELHGVAVGGDYRDVDEGRDNAIVTDDGGLTWRLAPRRFPGGYREAVAWTGPNAAIAIGPTGADFSLDGGQTWMPLDWPGAHALAIAPDGSGWTAGANGAVLRSALPAAMRRPRLRPARDPR